MRYIKTIIITLFIILTLTGCKTSEMEKLNEEAFLLYQSKDFNNAIEAYTEAIEQYPDYSDFYVNRGMAYHEIEENNLALSDMDKAISLDYNNAEAYSNRGAINLALGYNNTALEDLNKAIELKDKFKTKESLASAYLNMGTLQSVLGDKDIALKWYNEAIELGVKDPSILNAIGIVYIDLNQPEKSLEYFDSAIELDQDFAYAYSNRARAYFLLEKEDIALADIATSMSIDSNIPQSYLIKGQILSALDNSVEAVKVYTVALEKWPMYAEVYLHRGYEYMDDDHFSEALFDFAFARDYGLDEAYLPMGIAYREIKQYEDSISSFNLFVQYLGENPIVFVEMAKTYQRMKSYEAGLKMCDQAIKLNSNFVEPFLVKALIYEEINEKDQALNAAEQALDIDPTNIAVQELLLRIK